MSNKKRKYKRSPFSKENHAILNEWFDNNISNPYPSYFEKNQLMKQTGLKKTQIINWFVNERIRNKKYKKLNPKSNKFNYTPNIPYNKDTVPKELRKREANKKPRNVSPFNTHFSNEIIKILYN